MGASKFNELLTFQTLSTGLVLAQYCVEAAQRHEREQLHAAPSRPVFHVSGLPHDVPTDATFLCLQCLPCLPHKTFVNYAFWDFSGRMTLQKAIPLPSMSAIRDRFKMFSGCRTSQNKKKMRIHEGRRFLGSFLLPPAAYILFADISQMRVDKGNPLHIDGILEL